MFIAISVFITVISLSDSVSAKPKVDENNQCLRCHSMATLSYKDSSSGLIKNLSVDPGEFYNSNHKELKCTKCHDKEFEQFPHPKKLKKESLYCLDCHKDDLKLAQFNFPAIEKDFDASVHHQKLGDKFTCFACHDPHSFQIHARVNEDIKNTVLYDNQICLQCHNPGKQVNAYDDTLLPGITSAHSWLPHQNLHWKTVRCLDCHSAEGADTSGVAHLILPKEKAVKNCVECHSKNSMLTQTLYKFQSFEKRDKRGFFNAVIMNDAYVVGANRNYYLNLLSFIIFGITLIALLVHGYKLNVARNNYPQPKANHKEYFYPISLRIWHWINVTLFLLLIVTGISMQYSSPTHQLIPFSVDVSIHNAAGILLTLNYLFFIIDGLISGNYKQYIPMFKDLIKRLFTQAKFYITGIFKNQPHPYETTRHEKFNPLQQITYLVIMYVFVVIIIITGWAMLFPEFILNNFFGLSGFLLTDLLHTSAAFVLTLFMIGHIYLATTGATVLSNIKAMLTGWHETHKEN